MPDFLGAGVVHEDYMKNVGTFTKRSKDFAKANKMLGNKLPKGFTWHHHIDGHTLYGIPTDIHKSFTHRGGISLLREMRIIK